MNAFHANAAAKIESKRGKSCDATRGARSVGRRARRCGDNWVNTFGPAVCAGGGDIFLDRGPLSCIMHARTYVRTYVRDIHARRRHDRARTRFEENELRIDDTVEFQAARDLKRRTTRRGDFHKRSRANALLVIHPPIIASCWRLFTFERSIKIRGLRVLIRIGDQLTP